MYFILLVHFIRSKPIGICSVQKYSESKENEGPLSFAFQWKYTAEVIRPFFRTLLSIPVTTYSLSYLQNTFHRDK